MDLGPLPGHRGSFGALSLLVVHGPLIVVASLVKDPSSFIQEPWHAGSVFVAHGLRSHGMWDLLGPGVEPVSPALAGGFLIGRAHV